MPRLFTGLELPGSVTFALSLLRGGLSGARWGNPEDYHVTLRFIGDIDDRTADEIVDLLARVRRPHFTATFDGFGTFGGNKPHTLYAALAPSPQLVELQAEQERLCRRVGLESETRKYTPHVTLARLGREANPRAVAGYLALQGGTRIDPFRVERFALYSAKSGTGGGPYVVEETFKLEE